jgi:hypothetical protein
MDRGSVIGNICAGYNLAKCEALVFTYNCENACFRTNQNSLKLLRNTRIKDSDEEGMVVQPFCLIKNGFALYNYDCYILNSAYFYVSLYNSSSIISDFNTTYASFYFHKK